MEDVKVVMMEVIVGSVKVVVVMMMGKGRI